MPRRSITDVPSTPHFDFLTGTFALSHWKIPYIATTMAMEDAAASLNLATDLPGSEQIAWRLDELYQRDIDWPRVERQIVPYLNNLEVPQFFNSITIALLPFDTESGMLIGDFADEERWQAPKLEAAERFEKVIEVGPIVLGFWEDWSNPSDPGFRAGQLRWNSRQVFAAAIDGQHRLAAIKVVASGSRSNLAETRIPVLLLVFDRRLGFVEAEHRPTVEILRALFIDLNKHAQVVTRARQILLDDRDPHAVCVRQMVGTQMTEHLDELNELPPRLPLSLVDWHSEQAKFDEGPYLSTVLGLDWMVSKVLNTGPLRDFTDYRGVRKQISAIESQLGVSLSLARKRLDDLENIRLVPFVYTDDDLDLIENAFGSTWAEPLSHLLTKLSPYQGFISQRVARDSLSLEFQTWYMLYRRRQGDQYEGKATQEYRRFLGRLQNRDEPIGETKFQGILTALDRGKFGNLAFNVAFQRALVEAMIEYSKIRSSAIDEVAEVEPSEIEFEDLDVDIDLDEDEEDLEAEGDEVSDSEGFGYPQPATMGADLSARAHEFVDAMNVLIQGFPDVQTIDAEFVGSTLSPYFWLGTLRKPEGGIDFTQSASSRAKELLFVVALMRLYSELVAEEDADFDDFWDWVLAQDGPSVARRARRALARYSKVNGGGGRVLKAFDELHDEDSALLEAESRLRFVWSQMGL